MALAIYPIISQHHLEIVLCRQAGVAQIAVDFAPILDAAVIEQAQILSNDERHNSRLKALPKQQ